MSEDKPLPFVYQFAAGAVAGVSEVRAHSLSYLRLDSLTSNDARSWSCNSVVAYTSCAPWSDRLFRYPLDVVKTRVLVAVTAQISQMAAEMTSLDNCRKEKALEKKATTE